VSAHRLRAGLTGARSPMSAAVGYFWLCYRDRRNICMSFVITKAEPSMVPAVAVAPLFTPVACCATGSAWDGLVHGCTSLLK
jgi:hypothetical protein